MIVIIKLLLEVSLTFQTYILDTINFMIIPNLIYSTIFNSGFPK